MKQTLKLLALSMLAAGLFALVKTPAAHAATFDVATGTDAVINNSSCSLSEAVQNINDGAQTNNDCVATGDAYGTNDTINIPAGTITLTANLAGITESVTINGAGMGQTVVDGDGQWNGIQIAGDDIVVRKITVTGMLDLGVITSPGSSVQLDEVEANGANWGVSDPNGVVAGIVTSNDSANNVTATFKNVYVHNFNVDVMQVFGVGAIGGGNTGNLTFTMENATVSDITNTGIIQSVIVGAGLFSGGSTSGQISGSVANITVHNITSTNSGITGINFAVINTGSTEANLTIRNVTVTKLTAGGTSPFFGDLGTGAAIATAGGAGVSVIANMQVTNSLIADNNIANCGTANIGQVVGGLSGTFTANTTSNGGNLTDDTTCSSYFTQSSDQNNLGNLASTLGTLSNNGGFVPTIALLQGSPAIDAGVTVAGLTQDARLAARPQGNAFDSGAYESSFTRPQATLASTGENVKVILLVGLVIMALASFTIFRHIKARQLR